MLDILRQRAAARGESADRVTLAPWRNHDVRRTYRTTLSRLRIPEDVAEAVSAHSASWHVRDLRSLGQAAGEARGAGEVVGLSCRPGAPASD
jgi:hypothetical protein